MRVVENIKEWAETIGIVQHGIVHPNVAERCLGEWFECCFMIDLATCKKKMESERLHRGFLWAVEQAVPVRFHVMR